MFALRTHAEETLPERHGKWAPGRVRIKAIEHFTVGQKTHLPHSREVRLTTWKATCTLWIFFAMSQTLFLSPLLMPDSVPHDTLW
jgi:hypothetical protein